MAFPGIPETSKMEIFASKVHHLRTNNVNDNVSKIYLSGLIFGVVYIRGFIFGMLIGLHIRGGLIYWGRVNRILRYM